MTDVYQSGNLLDSLLAHGIVFHRSQSDRAEISICCPFCYEKRFRLGVNIEKDVAHCFNCEWKSRQAIKDLADAMDLGVLVTKGNEDAQTRGGEETGLGAGRPSLPDDFTSLYVDRPKDNLTKRALNYLCGRGVTPYQIRGHYIGASFCGRYAYRIVFPVYYGKQLQGLVTRDFTGQQDPPYLNSPGMKAVYNSPVKKRNKAVLCEGVFDCLALERVLPTINYDVLALLGRSLTESQEERLEEYRDIILWPDEDAPGVNGFLDIGKHLSLRHRIFVVSPLLNGRGKDAGEMGASDLAYKWATRTRLTEGLDLKLRAEVVLRD